MTARNRNDLTTTWSIEKLETTRESIINKKVTAARRLGFKRKDIRERERESKICFHCAGLCSPSKSNYENAENRNNSNDADDAQRSCARAKKGA